MPGSQSLRADLAHAEAALVAAEWAPSSGERFAQAQLAALRVAAVVIALRTQPRPDGRPTDVWALLARVAPEYAEWAGFFALTQPRSVAVRAALAEHRPAPVTVRQADDLLRDAQVFHGQVARRLLALAATAEEAAVSCLLGAVPRAGKSGSGRCRSMSTPSSSNPASAPTKPKVLPPA